MKQTSNSRIKLNRLHNGEKLTSNGGIRRGRI